MESMEQDVCNKSGDSVDTIMEVDETNAALEADPVDPDDHEAETLDIKPEELEHAAETAVAVKRESNSDEGICRW